MKSIYTGIMRKISADMRGTITCGRMENDRATKTKYFVLDDFPELQAAYGNEPDRMVIIFPTNEPTDWFFSRKTESVKVKASGKMFTRRFCDGDTCHFNMDMNIAGVDYQADYEYACICAANSSLPEKDRCKLYTNMKAFVLHPVTGKVIHHMPYSFVNHSEHSTGNVFSEIEKILKFTDGQLIGVPFIISVRMIEKPGKQSKSFPIWSLQALGTMDTIQERAKNALLPINEESAGLLQPGEIENTKLLHDGNQDEQSAPAEKSPSPAKPKSTTVSIIDPPSGESNKVRANLVSTLIEYRDEIYKEDEKSFNSKMTLFIKRNWNRDFDSLSETELRHCISRLAEMHKKKNGD